MAKKTARPTSTKPAQQRSKEEQWRKRMAAQARTGATTYAPTTNGTGSAVAEPEDDVLDEEATSATQSVTVAPTASTATRTVPATRTQTAVAPAKAGGAAMAAARRPLSPRGRLPQANVMTLEEEMHYVKRDITKLVVLTLSCLAILIILAFIVPMIVK